MQQVQISSDGTRYIVLQITQRPRQLSRYLAFDDKSCLVGFFDSVFAKYFDPIVYTKELGGRWWLVLWEQSGFETGFYQRVQRWFEINDGRLREVLSILDDAYMLSYPGGYVRRPSAVVTGFEHTRDGDRRRVEYLLSYTLIDEEDSGFFRVDLEGRSLHAWQQ